MRKVRLNSAKNIGTVYHFTTTIKRLESILDSGRIQAGASTLDKPFVCFGRSAPEIYLKSHTLGWKYGILLDGNVLSESYSFRSYGSYTEGFQDILITLRKYSDGDKSWFTLQGGDESPYLVGMQTVKAIMSWAEHLEESPEDFYKEEIADREEAEVWMFDTEDEDEYPSLTVQGKDVPMTAGIEITGMFAWEELPKNIQPIIIKSGYEAEERVWLMNRHKKSPYAQKDDLQVADVPFVDISRAIQGLCLPKSEKDSANIQALLDKYSDDIESGKLKITWYQG
jgi:hypothetical protein